jgi:AraC-like DNA-binding protein
MERRAKFYDQGGKLSYKADNCSPLKDAADSGELELTTLARDAYPGKKLGKTELTGIKSIGYWNIKKAQDWGLEWHTNEGIEICFLESGDLTFSLGDDKYNLTPNHLTITRPWISHKLGNPNVEMSKLHWIILDVGVRHPHQEWVWPKWVILNPKDISNLTLYFRQNEQPVWKATTDIKDCFIRIGKVIKDPTEKDYESKLRVLINSLLIALLEHFREGKILLDEELTESRRTVKLFLNSLEDHFYEPWNLSDMATFCKLGTTSFTKYCVEISNCTPMEYLNRIRLRKAAEMLVLQTGCSATDIAYHCGFSSAQYVTTVFKRHFRKTPQIFRKEKGERINEKA